MNINFDNWVEYEENICWYLYIINGHIYIIKYKKISDKILFYLNYSNVITESPYDNMDIDEFIGLKLQLSVLMSPGDFFINNSVDDDTFFFFINCGILQKNDIEKILDKCIHIYNVNNQLKIIIEVEEKELILI